MESDVHRRSFLLLAGAGVSIVAMALVACAGDDGGGDSDGKPVIVATTVQIGALAKEVAGDRVVLITLLGPGVDPHKYELTAQHRQAIDKSKVILRNGIGLDAFLDKAVSSDGNKKKLVTVTDGISIRRGEGEEDPHVWLNPLNAKVMVTNIANALAKADPSNAGTYSANAEAYHKKLDTTDAEIKKLIDSIPQANRKMVTNHDAFGYFIERYGLSFVGAVIPGVSTQSEASAKDIANLVETIKREKVRAIFAESSLDPKVAQQIAKDTGVRIVDDLYGDSLGEPGSGAETVDGMLLSNAKSIAEALK